jgi:hypothetical protein
MRALYLTLVGSIILGLPLVAGCDTTREAATPQVVAASPTYQPAPTPTLNAGHASLKLRVGMTEHEAITAIGWQPKSAEVETCGGSTGSPWQCRILKFGTDAGNLLVVYFSMQDSKTSIVNNWTVF